MAAIAARHAATLPITLRARATWRPLNLRRIGARTILTACANQTAASPGFGAQGIIRRVGAGTVTFAIWHQTGIRSGFRAFLIEAALLGGQTLGNARIRLIVPHAAARSRFLTANRAHAIRIVKSTGADNAAARATGRPCINDRRIKGREDIRTRIVASAFATAIVANLRNRAAVFFEAVRH